MFHEASRPHYGDIETAIPQEKAPHVSIIRSRIKDIMFGHEDNAWADEVTEEQRDNNRRKD